MRLNFQWKFGRVTHFTRCWVLWNMVAMLLNPLKVETRLLYLVMVLNTVKHDHQNLVSLLDSDLFWCGMNICGSDLVEHKTSVCPVLTDFPTIIGLSDVLLSKNVWQTFHTVRHYDSPDVFRHPMFSGSRRFCSPDVPLSSDVFFSLKHLANVLKHLQASVRSLQTSGRPFEKIWGTTGFFLMWLILGFLGPILLTLIWSGVNLPVVITKLFPVNHGAPNFCTNVKEESNCCTEPWNIGPSSPIKSNCKTKTKN